LGAGKGPKLDDQAPRGRGLSGITRDDGERLITGVRRRDGIRRTPGSVLIAVAAWLLALTGWSAFWDKEHGVWRVAEDDPNSDLYAESTDANAVIAYMKAHSGASSCPTAPPELATDSSRTVIRLGGSARTGPLALTASRRTLRPTGLPGWVRRHTGARSPAMSGACLFHGPDYANDWSYLEADALPSARRLGV
jgi:hypothetical protein